MSSSPLSVGWAAIAASLGADRPVDIVPLKKSRFLGRNAAQVDGLETPQYLTTLNSGTFPPGPHCQ